MNEQKKAALQAVEEQAGLFTDLADQIWDNPELSLKEFKATTLYCNALRKLGFQVTEKLCNIDTAFCVTNIAFVKYSKSLAVSD